MSSTIPLFDGLEAHCSGALWIPALGTAIVADVHLGYSWAQRRRGELGPLVDAGTRDKLLGLIADLAPARIVFLGDLVHAPRPADGERDYIEQVLRELAAHAELVAVRGNHDRAFAREFPDLPIQHVTEWSQSPVHAVHGDKPFAVPMNTTVVVGHIHPAIPVVDVAGAGTKVPVFVASSRCIVLPAFSPFAAGYNLLEGLPHDVRSLADDFHLIAATKKRLLPLGPMREALDRVLSACAGKPERFRFNKKLTKPFAAAAGSPNTPSPAAAPSRGSRSNPDRTRS